MARLFARTLAACASAAALVVVCSGTAHAQAVKGGLLGNIVDQSGFALPGVSVTITEVAGLRGHKSCKFGARTLRRE